MTGLSEISSSGELRDEQMAVTEQFSAYEELKSNGFNRLVKAQRGGVWYILKGLKEEYRGVEFYENLLEKEAQFGGRLEHPNIVRVYGTEEVEGIGKCVVMEYLEGQTMKEWLRGRPSGKARHRVLMQLMDAMEYYHKLQIVHRDLKPSNIIITKNGENVKLIDFGLSDSEQSAILKQPAGTRSYAAPEQMEEGEQVDCRADIYALGCIVEELFPLRLKVGRYSGVARKCESREREKRYQSVEEVRGAVQKEDRMRLWLPIVAVFVVTVGLATGIYWWRSGREVEVPEPEVVVEKEYVEGERDTVVVREEAEEVEPVVLVRTEYAIADKDTLLQPLKEDCRRYVEERVEEKYGKLRSDYRSGKFKYREQAFAYYTYVFFDTWKMIYGVMDGSEGEWGTQPNTVANENMYYEMMKISDSVSRIVKKEVVGGGLPSYKEMYKRGELSEEEIERVKREVDSVERQTREVQKRR